MTEKLIVAGFGGQGVILAGKLIAYAGMIEGKYVSHIPSYGAEMRGGTANCSVIVSDEEVASPLVPHPSTIIVLNRPSLDKFETMVVADGNVFINSSLIDRTVQRSDINIFHIPANDYAEQAGSGRATNMVMVGAFVAATGAVALEDVKNSLSEVVSKRNIRFNDINLLALDMGYDHLAREYGSFVSERKASR
jgi:2-oxoglutarate ferredoxin oxidoreductase subunit gamma